MVNAWSLLYDEYYGTMNETFPVNKKEPDDTVVISTGSTESVGPHFVNFDINDHDLNISFNSRYLIDVASQLDGEKIEIFFNDTGSPALIKDPSDFDSIFVVMPMKG